MGLPQPKPKYYTPEEYLELERASEVRHEYFDGEIFEMAGARRSHRRISTNVFLELGPQLRHRDCILYANDARVKITIENKYYYPDIVAICGEEEYEDDQEENLLNPTVIVEILSKSTEAFDRGRKFESYQTIQSLKEYILIAQEPFRVEQFVRQSANMWTYLDFRNQEDILKLESIGCELSLKDIYYKIPQKFPQEVVG